MKNGTKLERTAAQKDALRDGFHRLAEHFDHVLIICSLDSDHHEDAQAIDPDIFWKGSYVIAIGLADMAKTRLSYTKRNKLAPR